MTVPGRLEVDSTGRVRGPARISYNDPFPCVNGSPGVTGAMMGVLMHTMVGDLPGTIEVFNQPKFQASANFGIAQDGEIWQFGPLGSGWESWHAVAANRTWYGIEHADHGEPDNRLTDAQVTASAQLVELLSRFAGFPLQEANSPSERGYGVHYMGGAAFGGHTCPDRVPGQGPRSKQRPAILALAKQIRTGAPAFKDWIVPDGNTMSLVTVCATQHQQPAAVVRYTLGITGEFEKPFSGWLNGVLTGKIPAATALPADAKIRFPVKGTP